jgi:hypothetical protein
MPAASSSAGSLWKPIAERIACTHRRRAIRCRSGQKQRFAMLPLGASEQIERRTGPKPRPSFCHPDQSGLLAGETPGVRRTGSNSWLGRMWRWQ